MRMRLQEILLFLFLFSTSAFSHNILYPVSDDMVSNFMQSEQMSVSGERNIFRNISVSEKEQRDAELIEAIYKKDAKAVQELLKAGADPNAKTEHTDRQGKILWSGTALMVAISIDNSEGVRLLLEARAQFNNIKDLNDMSVIETAIRKGNPEIIDMLLK